MSLKTTLWLLAVVALLAGLLVFLQPDQMIPSGDSRQDLIQELPEGGAVRLELLLVSRESLSLEMRGNVWWFVEPTEDRADAGVMQQLHEVLMNNPRYEEDQNPALEIRKALGLEPPRARITLLGASGKALALRVGERDPTGSFVHVMIEGDPVLYKTGSNLSNVLERPLREFRDQTFFGGDGALLRRMEIHHPSKPPIILERPRTDWLVTEPRRFPANNTAVNQIKALLLLKVERFVKASPTPDDLHQAGLGEAVATRVVFDWGDRKVEARFSPINSDGPQAAGMAIDSERNHIVVVSGRSLLALSQADWEYRDPNVCSIPMVNAKWVRLRLRDRPDFEANYSGLLRRFEFESPFEGLVDDSRTGAFHAWLRQVSRMGAIAFLDQEELPPTPLGQDPWSVLGFDSPQATLEFRLVDSSGVTSELAIEVANPDGSGTVPVRRLGPYAGTAYLVPEQTMNKVLQVDPRQVLAVDLFPTDLLEVKQARIHDASGTRRRSLVRHPIRGAEYWSDPDNEERKTSDFQEYLSALPGAKVLEFLPRDPQPKDGFDSAVELVLTLEGGDRDRHELRLKLGARDPSGKTVVAMATKPGLPPRTVFRLEVWVLDDLLKLLEGEGE